MRNAVRRRLKSLCLASEWERGQAAPPQALPEAVQAAAGVHHPHARDASNRESTSCSRVDLFAAPGIITVPDAGHKC